jgi:hypothetical protein
VNRSSSSLIRRRSLLATPGLATRSSPTNGIRKSWHAWRASQAEANERKWKVEMMGSSPLARLAALDASEDGRDSPAPRAQTPGDLDYSHLGSLKLGSLVVTNGAPSPAASARKVTHRWSNADISQEEDYFTASEGTSSPIMWKAAARARAHSRSKSSTLPPRPPVHRDLRRADQSRKAKTMSRCDSPLKFDSQPELEPMRLRLHVVNKSADTLAKDYMADLPSSPFRASHSRSAQHDEGFSDGASFREEAFRILDGTIFSDPSTVVDMSRLTPDSSRASSEDSREERKGKRKSKRPIPSKADSGYSSGGSIRTPQRETAKNGKFPTRSNKPSTVVDMLKTQNNLDCDDAKSLYTFEQMLALPLSQKPLPPTPTEEIPEYRTPELHIPQISTFPNSQLGGPSPISPRTEISTASHWTVDSSASTQRRLQKRRPSAPDLPIVQSCHPVQDGTIPRVPSPVRAKFERRLSEAPDMECLTKTYLPKEHISAEESVITSPAVPIEFPSPSPSPVSRPRHHRRSQTERPPTPPSHGFRRSLSLFRGKQETEKPSENGSSYDRPALNVMDLGTIGSALGRSPYDAAMSDVPRKAVLSPTHPHQLGNALPRAKSMATMDAQSAVAFARVRSKDRGLLRPEMPQRPQSYHEINLESGEAVHSRRRPHSSYNEIPPVPVPEPSRRSASREPTADTEEIVASIEGPAGSGFRARSTGRGPVVSQLIDRYDQPGQKIRQAEHPDWESHSRLWSQRRKSIGEGLRQREEGPERASSQPPENMVTCDRYGGGLNYGYEGRGYGVGGSAGTRQLHSAASRKSMHFSNQFGVDLSDVPVFVQRR